MPRPAQRFLATLFLFAAKCVASAERTRAKAGLLAVALLLTLLATGRAEEPRDETGDIDDYNQWKQSLGAGQATDPATIVAVPGFRVQLLRSAGRGEGSWIALAFDPSGRIIVSREDKGLLRMTLAEGASTIGQVETVNDTLLECRGLLWAYDSLYANANNSKGLYRLRDTDGDDQFDEVKLLKATPGDVGHGRNDLALGPDGMIYSIHGDDVRLPDDYDPAGSTLRNYMDARLSGCDWDREFSNASMKLPGGYVARTDRDGQRWEVIAGGMRNPFGIALSATGELFTYDADMEWDVGAPWYRPTRILHLVSGADFGWRVGTGPWRPWYPDSLPALLDIGLGSPTAVRFGTGSLFPERYRRAMFVCDWAFGRILAVHMQEKGASFSATAEPFLSGRPLNVTDVEFGPDGAMYFLTGGRKTQSGLYRVTFVGEAASQEANAPQVDSPASSLRKWLESLQRDESPATPETIWPHLASDDPFVRHAARVALELRPVATWREAALAETDPTAATTALLALARLGSADTQAPLLKRLAELPWDQFNTDQRVAALRAWSLALARHERLADERLAPLAGLLDRRFPDAAPTANELLCELLVYLRSPQVVPKTLELLETVKTQEEKLYYLFVLRSAQGPWTLAQRRVYFDWLRQARVFYGANDLPRFVALIKADAVAELSEAERSALAPLLVDEPPAKEVIAPLAQRPFVRDWKLRDLAGSLDQVGQGRNLAAGKEVFAAAMCNRCHRFGGSGAAIGPDLTSLARRFGRVDILLSILAPSRVVDDKYRIVTIVTTDGQVLSGQFSGDDGKTVTLLPDLLAADKTLHVPKSQIESQTRSIVSAMPEGLLNSFSKEEVLDLLAYLESAGDPVAATPPPAQAIDAGSGKQLLIDSTFFASNQRITLTMNPPVKMGPALRPDRPWEAADMGFCVSVVQDNDLYKMWYLTESEAKYYICYATSSDGIRWEKPNLGLFAFHGSTDNNIVMTQPVETTVFLDPIAPPESRFKAISAMNWPDAKTAGLYVHTSPDGIHWTISKQRVLSVLPDTANQVFFDTRLKKYVAYIREWAPMRKIGRIEMDDVTKPWPINAVDKPYYIWGEGKIPVASREAPIVFSYDERDPPNSDHYNPACVQYPWADRAYFLFPSAFSHVSDKVDIQMATSRDGVAWTRLAREPYVGLGTSDEVDSCQLYMAVGMVQAGHKIFQYYGGAAIGHDASGIVANRHVPGTICRLEQRLDGFVSADADSQGGEFTTPPLTFDGTQLALNVNSGALGGCKVEIRDDQGQVLPGYSLDDCDEIRGNFLEKTLTWKGKADLAALGGRPVQLRFVMRSCKLFSFRFFDPARND